MSEPLTRLEEMNRKVQQDQIVPSKMPQFTEQTPMQKFVIDFMQRRKTQSGKNAGTKMLSVYCQVARFNNLRTYISQTFVGAGLMSKSEMFDFIMFLLENYLKGTYGNYETFDEFYLKEYGGDNGEN